MSDHRHHLADPDARRIERHDAQDHAEDARTTASEERWAAPVGGWQPGNATAQPSSVLRSHGEGGAGEPVVENAGAPSPNPNLNEGAVLCSSEATSADTGCSRSERSGLESASHAASSTGAAVGTPGDRTSSCSGGDVASDSNPVDGSYVREDEAFLAALEAYMDRLSERGRGDLRVKVHRLWWDLCAERFGGGEAA